MDQAFLSADYARIDAEAQHYIEHTQAQSARVNATLQKIRAMPWEALIEHSVAAGSRLFADFMVFKGISLGGSALKNIVPKINVFIDAAKSEKIVVSASGINAPGMETFENFAVAGKVVADNGVDTARHVSDIISRNPQLLQEGKVLGQVAYEVTRDCVDPSGTVWDFIKMTDKMYPNTRIPKSFELQVGNQRFWVAPNASKHLWEYVVRAKEISHGMPINSQSLLTSFKASVEKAIVFEIRYTEKPIIVDSWELMFSPPRSDGLLPVVKHAMYKPKGF